MRPTALLEDALRVRFALRGVQIPSYARRGRFQTVPTLQNAPSAQQDITVVPPAFVPSMNAPSATIARVEQRLQFLFAPLGHSGIALISSL